MLGQEQAGDGILPVVLYIVYCEPSQYWRFRKESRVFAGEQSGRTAPAPVPLASHSE